MRRGRSSVRAAKLNHRRLRALRAADDILSVKARPMEETSEIKAIQLVRKIRDFQAKELADKSPAEVVAFFNRAGDRGREDCAVRNAPQHQQGVAEAGELAGDGHRIGSQN
jgi:hypothetical protein